YIRPLTDDLQSRPLPFDIEDFLRVGQTLKEWFFFANSVVDGEGAVVPSHGRFSYVQYRYSPATVNVGYEYGSIETFEYGQTAAGISNQTDNGVPQPYIDTGRP